MHTQQVEDKDDQQDGAESDAGAATVSPATMSVIASAAAEDQDQKDDQYEKHAALRNAST